jgi:hypothetical protein
MKSSLLSKMSTCTPKSAFAWFGRQSQLSSVRSTLGVFAMSTMLAASGSAQSPFYSYQIAAKTGTVISGHTLQDFGEASLSNDGTMVFEATDQTGQEALYSMNLNTKAASVLAKQGDTIGGFTINSFGQYKRNNAGAVIFLATVNSTHQAIFENSGAGFKKVVAEGDTISGLPIQTLCQFDMNDAGAIIFSASWNSGANSGIFTPSLELVKTGDTFNGIKLLGVDPTMPDFFGIGMLDLGNDGVATFRGTYGSPTAPSYAIFSSQGLVVKGGETFAGVQIQGVRNYEFFDGGISKTGGLITWRDWDYDAVFVGQQLVAYDGLVVDGYTLHGPFDIVHPQELDGVAVNAQGESVFFTRSSDANGNDAFGVFSPTHAVFVGGSITVGGVTMDAYNATFNKYSLNDAGQLALSILRQLPGASPGPGPAVLLVATPNPRTLGNPSTLFASHSGLSWDATSYHSQGKTSLQLGSGKDAYQGFIWTPYGPGFTICSASLLGVCLSDQNGVATLGTRHDIWTIGAGNAVVDLTTGHSMEASGSVVTTGSAPTSWTFSY